MAIDDVTGGSGTDRMLGATKVYNAVFTDNKENANVKPSDFLNLMVAQMRNQDFLNPMDDAQFVTQMAQFSTMQQMMELAEWSKSNYAMSLVGKTVTASKFNVSGGLDTVTGVVDKISFVDNEYVLHIGDHKYSLSQIMEVLAEPQAGDSTDPAKDKAKDPELSLMDTSGVSLIDGGTTEDAAVVAWRAPVADEYTALQLNYTVYYSQKGPFDTLAEVQRGTIWGQENRTNLLVETIAGLEPGTEYYINVVVTDPSGNQAIYQPIKVTTKGGELEEVKKIEESAAVPEEGDGTEAEGAAEAEGAPSTEETPETDETPEMEEEEPIAAEDPGTEEH